MSHEECFKFCKECKMIISNCQYNQMTKRCIKKKTKEIIKKDEKIKTQEKWEPKKNGKHEIYTLDVGGNGNCLFYCLAYGFKTFYNSLGNGEMKKHNTSLYKYIQKDELLFRKKSVNALTLKLLNEKAIEMSKDISCEKERKTFLKTYYKFEGFWTLFGFHSHSKIKSLTNAMTKQDALSLAKKYKSESNHWGTEYDIAVFQNITNIGIIILQLNENKIFYCISNPKSYPYYILIYNYDQYHFQMGGIKIDGHIKCILKRSEIPLWITKKYKKECHVQL